MLSQTQPAAVIRAVVIIASAILALAACGGCAKKGAAVRFDTPGTPVFARDLELPANAYRLIGDGPPRGRFSCGVALARVNATPSESDADELVEIREIEQAYWQEAMRGVPAVRDLRFLTPIDRRRATPNSRDLCQAAERNGSDLLLLYSASRFAGNSAAIVGVIYDVPSRAALAVVHTAKQLPLPEDDIEDINEERGDQREFDASFQAARSFERATRECILALEQRSPRPTATQPHHWKPDPTLNWEFAVPARP